MSKIYYISDLHLFHNKVLQLSNRPFSDIEEMHQTIIKNWNQTVTSTLIVNLYIMRRRRNTVYGMNN